MHGVAFAQLASVVAVEERFVHLHIVDLPIMARAGRILRVPVERKAQIGEQSEEALSDHGGEGVARIAKQIHNHWIDVEMNVDRPRVVRSNSMSQSRETHGYESVSNP